MPLVFLSKTDRQGARLATYIHGELKLRRLRQEDLAKYMGISQQALSHKLSRRSFTFGDLIKICDYFNTDLEEVGRLVGVGE